MSDNELCILHGEQIKNLKSDTEEILKKLDKANDNFQKLHDKLFVGNGQPPITVQLDRLNTAKKIGTWVACLLTSACVVLVGRLVYLALAQ